MKNKILLIADREEILDEYIIANLGKDKYVVIENKTFGPYENIDKINGTNLLVCSSNNLADILSEDGLELSTDITREDIIGFMCNNLNRVLREKKNRESNYSVSIEEVPMQKWVIVAITINYKRYRGLWDSSYKTCYIKPEEMNINIKNNHIICISQNNGSCVYDYNFNKIIQGEYSSIVEIYQDLWELGHKDGTKQLVGTVNKQNEMIADISLYRYYSDLNSTYGVLRGGSDTKANYDIVYKKGRKLLGLNIDRIINIVGQDELEIDVSGNRYRIKCGKVIGPI